ncbi:histone-lysine N-methyltransferase SETMAR [Trichonephila clavipes]|nr:histone-lysine N-methyltransferase SETMAR [Trichonephila clavipes]
MFGNHGYPFDLKNVERKADCNGVSPDYYLFVVVGSQINSSQPSCWRIEEYQGSPAKSGFGPQAVLGISQALGPLESLKSYGPSRRDARVVGVSTNVWYYGLGCFWISPPNPRTPNSENPEQIRKIEELNILLQVHRILEVEFQNLQLKLVRQCQNWLAKFRSGNFDVEDAPRSGRPVEADKDAIKALVDANRRITTREIGLRLNLSNSTVKDHLKGLGLSSKFDVWVPHVLTERNLCRRIDDCDSLLKRHENYPFLKRIITGDEKGHRAKKMNRLKPFPKPIFTKKR